MNFFAAPVVFLILLWAFIYTLSFAAWTWKSKNRAGSAALFLLAVSIAVLPLYLLLFRY